MDYFYIDSLLAACILCGGLGYYIGHRGLTGVKSDMLDIKADIARLKAAVITTNPATAAVVSPSVTVTPAS